MTEYTNVYFVGEKKKSKLQSNLCIPKIRFMLTNLETANNLAAATGSSVQFVKLCWELGKNSTLSVC